MPGVARVSPDEALGDARALAALGIGGVILFGLPADKDAIGTGGWVGDGIVQETLRRLRDADLDLVLIADTCLCEYTDHGHCGPLLAGRPRRQRRHDRAVRPDGGRAGRGRRRHRRPQRHDGRPGRRDPPGLDAEGRAGHRDPRLRRQDRVRVLRPVPRRRGLDARVRRPPRLPDGPGQRPRVDARDRDRHGRGRRHAAGQARAAVARHPGRRPRAVRRPDRRLPGQRRVRVHRGGRAARLARPPARPDREHHLDPARGRRAS